MKITIHEGFHWGELVSAIATLPPDPQRHPLRPATILAPSPSLARWLSEALSEGRGIIANVDILTPDRFFSDLLAAHPPSAPSLQWLAPNLIWPILNCLKRPSLSPDLGPLKAWLEKEAAPQEGPEVRVSTFTLARTLAQVFARYADTQPPWLVAWERGESTPEDLWQATLWRHLRAEIPAPLPAEALLTLPVASHPQPRLIVFGSDALSPAQLAALIALSDHREVHLARLKSPNAHNPLSQTLGQRVAADHQRLPSPAASEPASPPASPPPARHRIGALQQGLRDLGALSPPPLPPPDGSLTCLTATTPLRQVEVLRDHLLSVLAADPTLQPRDILILTPDLPTFRPLIQAVFSEGDDPHTPPNPSAPALEKPVPPSAKLGFPRFQLPFARPAPPRNSLKAPLFSLFELADTPLHYHTVIELLSQPALLSAMGLTEQAWRDLQPRIQDAQIRFAEDASHRAALGYTESPQHTWTRGFQRLLLGHAMARSGLEHFGEIYPVDDIEGPSELDALGRFIDYTERLFQALGQLSASRPISDWCLDTQEILISLFGGSEANSASLQHILNILETLHTQSAPYEQGHLFDRQAFAALLSDQWRGRSHGLTTLPGGLQLADLNAFHGVPARIVALIGLDAHVFPRRRQPLAFDKAPDHSDEGLARHALLYTLLAAHDGLILLWSDRHATDLQPRETAGPLTDFLNALDALGHPLTPEKAPLHAFSTETFSGQPRSFDRRFLRAAQRQLVPPEPHQIWPPGGQLQRPLPSHIDLQRLAEILEDPCRVFARDQLQQSLPHRPHIPSDQPQTELNALDSWHIRRLLLDWTLSESPSEHHREAIVGIGLIPPGPLGDLAYRRLNQEAQEISILVQRHRARAGMDGPPQRIRVRIVLPGMRLHGHVDQLYGAHRILAQPGKVHAKQILSLYVHHLALIAERRKPAWSHLIGQDAIASLAPLSPADARDALRDLYAIALLGTQRPLPLFPSSSLAWAQYRLDHPFVDKIPQELRQGWSHHTRFGPLGEAHETANALFFPHTSADFPFSDPLFQALSERIFTPLVTPRPSIAGPTRPILNRRPR